METLKHIKRRQQQRERKENVPFTSCWFKYTEARLNIDSYENMKTKIKKKEEKKSHEAPDLF